MWYPRVQKSVSFEPFVAAVAIEERGPSLSIPSTAVARLADKDVGVQAAGVMEPFEIPWHSVSPGVAETGVWVSREGVLPFDSLIVAW